MVFQWFCPSERSGFASNSDYFFRLFLTPFLGSHFSSFFEIWCQKGSLWDPAEAKMAAKIGQVAPKWLQNIVPRAILCQPASKIRPQSLLGAILPVLEWVWDPFSWFWTPPGIFFMILASFRHQYFASFSQDAKSQQRTSKEPGTQRTPQNMILQIAIRIMPSTANKRFPQTALAQNGGRRCHAAWRIQSASGP